MVFPEPFTTTSPVLVNFSFTDLVSQSGNIIFYGTAETDNGGTTYSITQNTRNSNPTNTTASVPQTNPNKTIDVDFDITFNTNQRIRGDVILSVPVSAQRNRASNYNTYLVYSLVRDPSGDNETIMSGQSDNRTTAAVSTNRYRYVTKENVASEINVQAGDLLRLNIQVWTTLAPGGGMGTVWLYHDPLSTEAALDSVSTELKLTLPLVLDL